MLSLLSNKIAVVNGLTSFGCLTYISFSRIEHLVDTAFRLLKVFSDNDNAVRIALWVKRLRVSRSDRDSSP